MAQLGLECFMLRAEHPGLYPYLISINRLSPMGATISAQRVEARDDTKIRVKDVNEPLDIV